MLLNLIIMKKEKRKPKIIKKINLTVEVDIQQPTFFFLFLVIDIHLANENNIFMTTAIY